MNDYNDEPEFIGQLRWVYSTEPGDGTRFLQQAYPTVYGLQWRDIPEVSW